MGRPRYDVTVVERPPARTAAGLSGVAFIVGQTERGNHLAPDACYSMQDYKLKCGGRTGFTAMYDWAETFFARGGKVLYVQRVVGDTPVYATLNLFDQSGSNNPADIALVLTARSVGSWGNSLNGEVLAGEDTGEFKVAVTHDTDDEIAFTSPSFPDRASAVAWFADNPYCTLTLGASDEDPRAAASASLTSGDADTATIDDDSHQTACDRVLADLGPGQIVMPGATSTTKQQMLLNHAADRNRFAVLDLADVASSATLKAAGLAARALDNEEYGASFAPWATIPGVVGGTERAVPYSAVVCGDIARLEATGASPNEPAAGVNSIGPFVTGLTQVAWTDAEHDTLHDAGVNVAREMQGAVRTYGWRTLAHPVSNRGVLQINNQRLMMEIKHKIGEVLERFLFKQIDGRRHLFAQLAGEIGGVLAPYYTAGALYGETADEAYVIDVGETVNTPETIAAQELHTDIGVRVSPHTELAFARISKTGITEVI